ncbi:hypothetical protein Plec18170_007883 [Paecilomyces lecythidis]
MALTIHAELYWDAIKPGRYTWKLKELHNKYGPIIRSNPSEIHINDPDFFDKVYPSGSKRRVDKPYAEVFGTSTDVFAAVKHEDHRMYRNAVNNYFSRRAILEIEPAIQRCIDELCTRFDSAIETGELISVGYAFAALTADVINEYCFCGTYHAVLSPDFNKAAYTFYLRFTMLGNVTKSLPWVLKIVKAAPPSLIGWFFPYIGQGFRAQQQYAEKVKEIQDGTDRAWELSEHGSLIRGLIESRLPEKEKTAERLKDWVQTFLTAGMFTVGHTLKCGTYHILANEGIKDKLLRELDSVFPDLSRPPSLSELEKLPYLTNVINESLRMSYGVSRRLTRSFPDDILQYREWVIPPGTPVGMTSVHIHDNPDIFPQPFEFQPERWKGEEGRRRQKYLVAFNKGTRVCLGLTLAWEELYKTFACIFRKYDMELVGAVRERDVDASHDYFNAETSLKSPGLFVRVTSKRP